MSAPHIDLDQLEAAAKAATPGPWTYSRMTETEDPEIGAANGSRVAALVAADITKQNSAYIAAANPAVVLELVARLRRAEAEAAELRATAHKWLCETWTVGQQLSTTNSLIRHDELSIVMSTRQGDTLFSAGRHVSPEQIRSFAGGAMSHVSLEASRVYQQLQEHIASAMPNDRLDDVLPLMAQKEGGNA